MSKKLIKLLTLLTTILWLTYLSTFGRIVPEEEYVITGFIATAIGYIFWSFVAIVWRFFFGDFDNETNAFFLKKILAPIVAGVTVGCVSFIITGEFSFSSGGAIFGSFLTVVFNK